jgi:RecB family exonuclease
MDPLERGRAVHEILEQYVRSLAGGGFSGRRPEDLQNSLAGFSRAFLEKLRPSGIPDLLWEVERESLEAMLQNWLAFECSRAGEGYIPASFESPFGAFPGEEHLPYTVATGAYRFEFRGRIDRIDVSADGKNGRVIDYKTGRIPATMAKSSRPVLMAGEKTQMAVYRGALSVLTDFKHIESVEGEYLFLQPRDHKVVSCSYTDEALREAGRRLQQVLEIVGESISGGVFFARTAGILRPEGHCDFCEYVMICGKDRSHREDLKSSDPAVLRFEQIAAIDTSLEDA